ncbi:small multi-drug export protein, partial [Methanoculleus sp. UBA331]|uniref:small multi-drug export protein n=1 Tax=Methanoculleus sp. UBA331 TaxID=1915502 RepID=UPI00319EB1C3
FVGLIAFVSLPFDGSGSIVGSIVGRMLGMTKTEVLSCITVGGLLGSFTIALGI